MSAERDTAAASTEPLISFRGIGHTYRGLRRRVRAVDDFTLDIRGGEIFGLAGPNGAGKSTLIALLLGFMRPTNGALRIAGLDPRSYVERNGIGYVSELMNVPPRWELRESLVRYGLLSGIGKAELKTRVDAAIVRLGIEEHVGKSVKQLSKGNLQRLGIAQALLRDERVLIFDEPTHGLDPVWTLRFREIVDELRADDRVVFIASHNLDELQRLADRVAIIDHGKLQRVVDVREGGSVSDVPYRLVTAAGGDAVPSVFRGAVAVSPDQYDLPPMPLERLNALLSELLARGVIVRSLAPVESSLERAFRDAVADAAEGAP